MRKTKKRQIKYSAREILCSAYGLLLEEKLPWHWRIRDEEDLVLFDWYPTTGTLMIYNKKKCRFTRLENASMDAENVAVIIRNELKNKRNAN